MKVCKDVVVTLAVIGTGIMLPTGSQAQSPNSNNAAPIVSNLGTCLQAKNTSNGSSVLSGVCKNGLSSQMWYRDGAKIVHNSGKCLTVRHTDKSVILYDCHGRANQDWIKSRQIFMNKLEGTCLDVKDSRKTDATPVIAATCYGNKNQAWTHGDEQTASSHKRGRVSLKGGVFSLKDQLKAGQFFETRFSNGLYKAIMQDGCNFVLYDPNSNPIWTSGTHGKGQNCYLSLTAENGVAYLNIIDGSGQRVWKSAGSDPNLRDVSQPYMEIGQGNLVIRESILNGHYVRTLWSSERPVPSETKTVLPNAYGKQTVSIDCLVSGADDEETGNRITVRWYAADGRKIGGTYRDGISTCHGANDKWTLKNSEEAAYITVNTNGSDGYLMDQILLYRDGKLVRTHGGNDSRGWCLSTDNTDHNKGNFYGHSVDSKCPPTRRFNY